MHMPNEIISRKLLLLLFHTKELYLHNNINLYELLRLQNLEDKRQFWGRP